jgi:very-short-patch-repair endonuclease
MSLDRNPKLIEVAKQVCRDLRRRQTKAEKIFWEAVRRKAFFGKKFYRQYAIFHDYLGKETFFVADFYCHSEKLVVELDGKIHDYTKHHDAMRTELINSNGIRVIRYKNEEVENNIEDVMRRLERELDIKQNSPPFPRERQGESSQE